MEIIEGAPLKSRKKEDNSSQTKPLYQRITDALRERIATGIWADGDALPSRRALASELGTTHITIDKAIRQLVKEGLLSATVGSGTFVRAKTETPATLPPHAASRLRIGVVLGAHTFSHEDAPRAQQNPYFGELLRGIQDAFFGRDVDANYIGLSRGDYHRLPIQEFSGLIVIAPTLADFAEIRTLAENHRVISVGLSSDAEPDDDRFPAVDTDNFQGGYDAVRHLLDLGHTRIGLINVSLQQANLYDRYRGYMAALTSARINIEPESLLIYPAYNAISHETFIDRWLTDLRDRGRLPTALFSCDLQMTQAALASLARLEISIPDQISIVGYDDSTDFKYHSPPITVVSQPIYQMGRRAAERMLQSLEGVDGSPLSGTERLPCELIVRQSTRSLSSK